MAQDVQRLMALAYPGEKSSLSEHIARDAFLTALDDAEFELKVQEREPVDLDSAVKLAQRFEVYKATVETSSGTRHRLNRQVMEESEQIMPRTDLETRLINVERRLQDTRLSPRSEPKQQPSSVPPLSPESPLAQ